MCVRRVEIWLLFHVSAHDQEGVKPSPDAQLPMWEIALRVIDMLPAGREYLVYRRV